nr:hypothetical protein [uncultured Lichenicoccus sp.]
MSTRGYLNATLETDDGADSVNLRIHYVFRAGAPAIMYQRNGDPGWPEDPDEIEFNYVEILEPLEPGQRPVWHFVHSAEVRFDTNLQNWAEAYLDEHFAEVIETVAAEVAEAAEYRAELRAER